mgnify:CR=1 FL=1
MSRSELKTGPSNANQSTRKLMKMLEVMSQSVGAMRLYDIAEQCEMNPTTTLRFLTTLQSMGYVTQNAKNSRYSFTHKICRLGEGLQKLQGMRNICVPYLNALAGAFGAAAGLAVEDDLSVLYLETVYPPQSGEETREKLENMADLHCTAAGKLFLIQYTQEQWDRLLAVKGLPPKTAKTVTSREKLQKELLLAQIKGYAYTEEERIYGRCCVAVPIRDYTNKIIAALNVGGPLTVMTREHIQQHMDLLRESADKISLYMGYDKTQQKDGIYQR